MEVTAPTISSSQ